MDIQTSKDLLMKCIQTTQGAVSSKGTSPILSNLLLEAYEQKLKVTATDLDVAVSCVVDVEVKEEGAITLPAKKFNDIIREISGDEAIRIQVKKNFTVQIEGAGSFFRLMGTPKDDFPQISTFNSKEAVRLPQALLSQMIRLTSFAMSRDEARYVLNGILFLFLPKSLRLVATDGRRLAMIEKDLPQPSPFQKNLIVPIKAIQELGRNLEEEGEVLLMVKDNQIQFTLNNTLLTSRLIEGEFPNYEQVIPKKTKEHLQLNTQAFLSAARRASIFTNQESQSVKINLAKNRMVISKTTPNLGEVREELDTQYQGGEFTIGFNPSYLIDVLKNIKEDTVRFELIDPEKPGVIKVGEQYTYIVLPMQLT